jgi:hypothetical protein
MKYRYYITDTLEGLVNGTDDTETAKIFAMSEDFYVVDSEEGKWLIPNGETVDIDYAEIEPAEEEEE